MARKLTREQAATRYLEASMSAGYTGLPREHREAYRSQMRELERKHPGTRRRAIAGSPRHYSRRLSAGEREHREQLRQREGLGMGDVERIGRELDAEPRPRTARERAGEIGAELAGGAGPRGARRATGAVSGGGNIVLYFAGIALLLSLAYLLLTGKGPGALGGLVTAGVGALGTFVRPEDPIRKLEGALGAAPLPASPAAGVEGAVSAPAPLAGQHGLEAGAPLGSGSKLRALFPGSSRYSVSRTDAGKDFSGIEGHIGAVASGEIVAVHNYSGFGTTIFQKLDQPIAGKSYVYYALETGGRAPAKLPRRVAAGTPLAAGTGGVIEVGLSSSADVTGIEQNPSSAQHYTPTGAAFTRALGLTP